MCATDDGFVSVQTAIFPFSSTSSFVKQLCSNLGYNKCDRKLRFFFLSCDSSNPLNFGLWLRTLQYIKWIDSIMLRASSIWFLLDLNALRFSLPALTDSVAREFQKTKRIVIFLNLVYVASLRFSLVFLCVQFLFSAAALHLLGKMDK